jgi:hypothetical protein
MENEMLTEEPDGYKVNSGDPLHYKDVDDISAYEATLDSTLHELSKFEELNPAVKEMQQGLLNLQAAIKEKYATYEWKNL